MGSRDILELRLLLQDVAAPASEELAPGLYAAAVLSADPEQSRYVDTTEKTYGDPYSSLSVVNLDPNYCYGKLVQNISYPTNWTSDVDPSAPRNNYPRPAMVSNFQDPSASLCAW